MSEMTEAVKRLLGEATRDEPPAFLSREPANAWRKLTRRKKLPPAVVQTAIDQLAAEYDEEVFAAIAGLIEKHGTDRAKNEALRQAGSGLALYRSGFCARYLESRSSKVLAAALFELHGQIARMTEPVELKRVAAIFFHYGSDEHLEILKGASQDDLLNDEQKSAYKEVLITLLLLRTHLFHPAHA